MMGQDRRASRARLVFCIGAALVALCMGLGCTGKTRGVGAAEPRLLPVSGDVRVGECADPAAQGVFGDAPALQHADRDLDGDGIDEVVVADRNLCTADSNCHWNIYRTQGECHRYVGTISAASIQRLARRGEAGFFGLRGWWNLTGGRRMLMQEFAFQRGGYRLVDALLCRHVEDDRIVCEERGR